MAVDHEALYRLIYEQQWQTVLQHLYAHRTAIARESLLSHAAATFIEAFLSALSTHGAASFPEELETLFLLHTGGFYRLSSSSFAPVVAALVTLHQADAEAARSYARHCPQHPVCAAVLDAHTPPQPIDHAITERLSVTRTPPLQPTDATTGLFKSQQEVDFFMAVRTVFATYFVYPNVALHSILDYEKIKAALNAEERAYFFRATVDCVVFDQHNHYRPCYFFELDSPLHDTDARQHRDKMKDHILALAGQTIHRLRKRDAAVNTQDFVRLLRELMT